MHDDLEALKATIVKLRTELSKRDEAEFNNLKKLLDDALFQTKDIETIFLKTVEKLAIEELLAITGSANNPTSDQLGFKFADVIKQTATITLASELENGIRKTKTRFIDVVSKVLASPMTKAVLGSSPFGAIASSVINIASGFVQNDIKKGKENGDKIQYIENIAPVDGAKIKDFMEKLKDYIKFYEDLSEVYSAFSGNFKSLHEMNSSLKDKLDGYHSKYLKALNLDEEAGGLATQFNDIFRVVDEDGLPNYGAVLAKDVVVKAKKIAIKAPDFMNEVLSFQSAVARNLQQFLNGYVAVLEKALNWDESLIDKQKLKDLISLLTKYKTLALSVTMRDKKIVTVEINNLLLERKILITRDMNGQDRLYLVPEVSLPISLRTEQSGLAFPAAEDVITRGNVIGPDL